MFFLLTQFILFSSSKGTYQRNRCSFKNNIKLHIFIFIVRPVRFIYLCIKFCAVPAHTVTKVLIKDLGALSKNFYLFIQFTMFSYAKVPYKELSKKIQNPIFSFLQCALSDIFIFTSKFLFNLLTQFKKILFNKR